MKKFKSGVSGFAIIYVVLLIFILFALGLIITYITVNSLETSANETAAQRAFYIAEAGVEYSKHELKNNPSWTAGFTNFGFTNTLGETIGYFNVTIETDSLNLKKIISTGSYNNHQDTIIVIFESSASNKEMFNHLILAKQSINISSDSLINYYTDFSEYATGEQPFDWTHRWATAGITFTVENDGSATGGKILRKALSNDLRTMLSWNPANGGQDIEILAKHRFSSVAAQIDYLFIRASGNSGSENNYSAIYLTGTIYLAKRTNGVITVLSNTAFPILANTYYWTRLRATGNNIRMKIWADGAAEPGAWTFTAIDGTHISGWAGVGNLNNRQTDFDIVSFGFNGATALSASTPFPLLSYLEGNKIHSNGSLFLSSHAICSGVALTSVDDGDTYINILSFDTAGYRAEASTFGQIAAGNFGFLDNTNYSNKWYVEGDATIGGVPWWNKNYRRRYKLRIRNNNNNGVAVTTGYSINFNIDTTALINAGLLRSDLNDLRVVRYSGGTNTELNRVYLPRADHRGLWFTIQENINPSNNNDNYYVYYANPSAGAAPADSNQVFLWYDDFSTNTLANYNNGRHLNLHGNAVSFMAYDGVNRRLTFDTDDNRGAGIRINAINEQNVLIQCDVSVNLTYPTSGTFGLSTKYQNANTNVLAHISNSDYNSPLISLDGERETNIIADPPGNFYFPANGTSHTLTFASGESFRFGAISRSDYLFWMNNILRASSTDNTIRSLNSGRVVFEAAQQRGWLDNIIVRRFISPEPTVSILDEGNTEINGTICAAGDIIVVGLQRVSVLKNSDTYPSIVTKGNIYFNGTASNDLQKPLFHGLIFADKNIDIDNLRLEGSIYSAGWFRSSGAIDIRYETNVNRDPYKNPPPYFYINASDFKIQKWLNLR